MSAHTPLPWTTAGVANPTTDPRQSVWGPRPHDAQSGEWIAKDVTPQNVQFILRACNSHYDLLHALRRLRDLPVDCSQETDREVWAFAHAVIAKAEGRS